MNKTSIWKPVWSTLARVASSNRRALAWLLGVGLCASLNAGDFVNLGFNDPDLSHAYYEEWRRCSVAPVTEALRGWSISTPEPLPYQGFISVTGGNPPFGLDPSPPDPSWEARFGAYTLNINYYRDVGLTDPRNSVRIYQTGTVPAGSALLRFYEFSGGGPSDAPIVVYVSGVQQPTIGPSWGGDRSVDVSAFAGQEVTLEFLIPGAMYCRFDVYGFSSVPEPSTWALLALGGAALWRFRRRCRAT